MLLTSALVVPRLDTDAFNGDETDTLISAGIRQDGPQYLTEVWRHTAPRAAPGWGGLIAAWARVAGWSEVAVRSLATFAGLLTIALVFRMGSDLFSPTAGIIAASLLAASVFHLAYMLRAGSYAGVALFASLAVWSFRKNALSSRPPDGLAQGGLLLGATGLMFLHYLASLILVPLAAFHLLFVPRGRSWWHTTIIFALTALAGALQLSFISRGLSYTAREDMGSRVLSAPALIYELLGGLGNGILAVSTPAQKALAIGLFLFLIACFLRRIRRKGINDPYAFLGAILIAFLVLVASVNELLRIIVDDRIRYLMPLWPLGAVLAGAILERHLRGNRTAITFVLVVWLGLGGSLFLATNYRYHLGYFFRSDLHRAAAALPELVPEEDGLVVSTDGSWHRIRHQSWVAQAGKMKFPFQVYVSVQDEALATLAAAGSWHPFVWLLRHHDSFAFSSGEASDSGIVFCEGLEYLAGFTLERYARAASGCDGPGVRLAFDNNIRLLAFALMQEPDLLRLEAGLVSDDDDLLSHYSLALHIIDPRSGERLTQGDVGVGPGAFVPLRSDVDVSALPPGDYEIHVALYDWQTGERINARNLQTGAIGDMHVLERFRLD